MHVAFRVGGEEDRRICGGPCVEGRTPGASLRRALAHRSETQARDVYDLDLLFSRAGPTRKAVLAALGPVPPQAQERALALSFDEFAGQVGSFLPAEAALDRDAWEAMQLRVAEILAEAPT